LSTVQPGSARPGGRTARTRAAVCAATLEELAAHGYTGLTVENVAERAGVHRTTVYRRWGGPDGLVVDALALTSEDSWAPPDTGSLAGDLRGLAFEVVDVFGDPVAGAAPRAFMTAAFHSERAGAAMRELLAQRHQRSEVAVARAVDRGELPADTDAAALLRAVTAPLYSRLILAGERADRAVAEQSVAAALAAAAGGAFRRQGSTATAAPHREP
jgi:AcrR family transcriptional regulator